jgi:cytochrome c oxidase subunit II
VNFRLAPPSASTLSGQVDALLWTELLICAGFAFAIAFLIVRFAIRYRAGSAVDRTPSRLNVQLIETAWIVGPLAIALGMFGAGAVLFFRLRQAPEGAMEVVVVGKRWMWRLQHPGGRREINELHVPKGRAVKLVMSSQDVIHSFFIPAFRVKQDVLPGRTTTLWFEATRTGTFHLFCAEYCGTDHSGMIGRVVVLEPTDYQRWLSGESVGEPSLAGGAAGPATGRAVFERHGCHTCHTPGALKRAPDLAGVFGSRVVLRDGTTLLADEAYLRESILDPAAKLVKGYEALMPSFRGRISEEELRLLVEYVRTLGNAP